MNHETHSRVASSTASRDFQGATYVANTLYDFLPAGGAVTVKMSVIPGTHRPSHTMVGEPPRSVVCSAEFDMSLADVNHLYERLFNAVLALNRSLNEIHNDP